MKITRFIAATAVGLTGLPAQATTLTSLFDSFYVISDSLSDNGNTAALVGAVNEQQPVPLPLPAPSPLQQPGVASDGFTWAKEFTDAFEDAGKATANLAFASARARDNGDGIPDLGAQLDAATEVTSSFTFDVAPIGPVTISGTVPKYADGGGGLLDRIGDGTGRELVTIFIGGNDFLDVGRTPNREEQAAILSGAFTAIQTGMFTALAQGVQDFVLMSIPDFSALPGPNMLPEDDPRRLALQAPAAEFNDALFGTETMPGLADALRLSGATVTEVDIFALLTDDEILSFFGPDFDTLNACLTVAETRPLTSCEGFLFWDDIHPTAQGHQLIAMATRDALAETYGLQPVPLPASALLLLGALGGLAVLRRRTQR